MGPKDRRTAACILSTAALGLLLLPGTVPAEPRQITAGPWRVDADEVGVATVFLAGQPLIRHGRYVGYKPAWQGTAFTLNGSRVTATENRVAWHKQTDNVQDCTLTAELDTEGFRFGVATRLMAPGPSEFSVSILPEAVRAAETHLVVQVDGKRRHIALKDAAFDRFSVGQELVFETPARTLTFTCSHMQLQDRRPSGNGFFLVRVLSSAGQQVRDVESSIRIQVVDVPRDLQAGRTRYLAQVPQTHRAVAVRNPDLEERVQHWHHSSLAAADDEVRHSGAMSARLHIEEPLASRNDAYITQTVPVVPGSTYELAAWVRTDNVRPAVVGGMAATGATVIVEFADQQGKWFAAGAYAKGLYGTREWQRVSTGPALAPEGAGFAILYLAMRSLGTAWYDDVMFTEVTDHILLNSPLDGQTIDDNTPQLDWTIRLPAVATLELSRTEAFTEPAVKQTVSDQPPVSLTTVLEPGDWYWRVSCGPKRVSPTWRFIQTAEAERDCTPPVIGAAHRFLRTARESVQVPVRDNVGIATHRIVLDGNPVETILRGGHIITTPETEWSDGLHRLRISVADATGNRDERTIYLTHLQNVDARTWLLERGTILGDAPDFPLGMYGIRIQDMPEIAAAGFTLVHSYTWDGAGDVRSAVEYLDAARSHGLSVFMGLCRKELIAGNDDFVAERVGSLMGHPALYAWYLYDEPDLPHQYVRPEELARLCRLIKRLDPFHPVILTCAGNSAVPKYRDTGDVYWTQVYGNTRFVASRISTNRDDLRPGTAQAAICHCYDRAQSGAGKGDGAPFDPAAFQPDPRTLRANAFMALAKRSSGLLWWWWGGGAGPRFRTIKYAPEAWRGLKHTVADIRALRPLLTAEGKVATATLEAAEGIEVHVWEKQVGDRVIVIAVNRDEAPCEVRIPLQFALKNTQGRERFVDRTVEAIDGTLTASFEPLDVHVYELPATPP